MDWSDRIGRRIKLRDLHIVLAVAEAGSMAKASQRLAISHPVVSKTISDLEHTLAVKLFDRTSQGVELTSYGQALLKCGVNVFDEMRQGLKQIEFPGEIGVQRFLADPQLLRQIVHSHTAESVTEKVRSCRIDDSLSARITPSSGGCLVCQFHIHDSFSTTWKLIQFI